MKRRQVLMLGAAAAATVAMPGILRAAPSSGITADEILLGGVMPITGPVRIASEPYELGIRAVFDAANESGGINGRKITWQIEDDAYQTSRAVAAAKKLVESDDVFMIFGQHGTPTGFAMAPYVEEQGVPMMMTTAGPPQKKYVFGGLANYAVHGHELMSYLLKQGGFKKVGFLYQNDEIGEAGRAGINKALKENGAELGADVGFERGTTEFSSQILKVRDAGVDAVIIMTSGPSFATIVKTADGLGVKPQWATYSVASISTVRSLLGPLINGIVYASEIESFNSQEPGVLEARDVIAKHYPQIRLDWGSMLGYAHAKLLVGVLQKMGSDLTRDGLVGALEQTSGVVTGTTAPMGFTPSNHNAAKALKMFQYQGEDPAAQTDWIDVSGFSLD